MNRGERPEFGPRLAHRSKVSRASEAVSGAPSKVPTAGPATLTIARHFGNAPRLAPNALVVSSLTFTSTAQALAAGSCDDILAFHPAASAASSCQRRRLSRATP